MEGGIGESQNLIPMPNRYVREAAIESERVNALSWQAEVFWRRLVTRVDDFGRFTALVPLLRASIFPLQLDKVKDADVAKLLAECDKVGVLATYQVDGKPYLALAKWENGRAMKSRYPCPPEDVCKRLQTFVFSSEQRKGKTSDSDSDNDHDNDSDNDHGGASAPSPWLLDLGVDLQDPLRTEECLAVAKEWLAHRMEIRKPYKLTGLRNAVASWAKDFTPDTFPAAVRRSMANGWQGIFSNDNTNRRPGGAGHGGPTPAERRNSTLDPIDVANVRANAAASAERDRKRLEEDPDYNPFYS